MSLPLTRSEYQMELLAKIAGQDRLGLKESLKTGSARLLESNSNYHYLLDDAEPEYSVMHFVHKGLAEEVLTIEDAEEVLQITMAEATQKRNFELFSDLNEFIRDPKVNAHKSAILMAFDKNASPLSIKTGEATALTTASHQYWLRDRKTQQALEPFLKDKMKHAQGTQRHELDENYLREKRGHIKKLFTKEERIEANPNAFYARFASMAFYSGADIDAKDIPKLGEKEIDVTAKNFQMHMNGADMMRPGQEVLNPNEMGRKFYTMMEETSKHMVLPVYLQSLHNKNAMMKGGSKVRMQNHCRDETFRMLFGEHNGQEAVSLNKTIKVFDRWQGQQKNIKGAIPKNDQMVWNPLSPEPFVGKNGYMIREITDYQELRQQAEEFNNCSAGHLNTLLTENGHAFLMERQMENDETEKLMAEFVIIEDKQTGSLSFEITEKPDRMRSNYEDVIRGSDEAKADFTEMVSKFKSGELPFDWEQQKADQQARAIAGYTEDCDYNPFNPVARDAVYNAYTRVALASNTDYKRFKNYRNSEDFAQKSGLKAGADKYVSTALFNDSARELLQAPVVQSSADPSPLIIQQRRPASHL